MTKQSVEEIKEKMRKLLENSIHNEEKEPQSIGNPEKIFDNEENENEDGESAPTEKQQQGRDKGSKGKD